MLRIAIYPNFQKKNALSCAKEVIARLHQFGGEIWIDNSCQAEFAEFSYIRYDYFSALIHKIDIVIAIGGDGTMLRCAKEMIGSKALLLGINTGTLGFMAGLETDELNELERLFYGNYDLSPRIMIEGALKHGNNVQTFTALNDIVVSSLYGKVFDFTVCSNDNLIGRYRADGIICSTPTGSTAYALSAGGPLLEPELSCIELTFVCPHSLFNRPLLVSSDRRITIQHTTRDNINILLSADGEKPISFPMGDKLDIVKSKHSISLINLRNGGFYDAVNRKLMQSIKGFS